jgi:predicted nucleic acid-binding protein
MIIADTDVLIDFLADRGPGSERVSVELSRGLLRTTAVSRFELLCGARDVGHEKAVRQLLAVLPA